MPMGMSWTHARLSVFIPHFPVERKDAGEMAHSVYPYRRGVLELLVF